MGAISLLFVLNLLVAGLTAAAYGFVLATSGRLTIDRSAEPAWRRFHVRYYTFALSFIAFDMEMAYMYPWAVVFRSSGWGSSTLTQRRPRRGEPWDDSTDSRS